jgi:MFS family permease
MAINPAPNINTTLNRSRQYRLWLLSAATILYWASMYIYVPILSPYLEGRGLSVGLIGFIIGSYGITQILVRLPLGLYSDAMRRRKPFMIAGLLAGAVSCVCFLLPGSWEGPLAGRLLAGICASAWVPFSVLYASYYPGHRISQAMGTLSFLTVSGQIVGMLGSGWLTGIGGWNATFRIGIVLAVLGICVVLFVQEPTSKSSPHAAPSEIPDRKKVFRSITLWKVSSLSVMAHGILFITMFGFTPLYAVQLGANEAQLTGIVAAFMIPHAMLSLISGRFLAPRFGTKRILIIGYLLAAVFTALMPYCHSLGLLALTQACNGAAQALYFPILLGMAIQDFPPSLRASAMGLYQSLYSFGMFLGPYLAGGLNAVGGLKAGFLFGAALGLTAALVSLIYFRKSLNPKPQNAR